jgi:hypothetical protein
VEDGQGGLILKFKLKEQYEESIGQPYMLNRRSNEAESYEPEHNLLAQRSSLWRERNTSYSLRNSLACDEILRQFL